MSTVTPTATGRVRKPRASRAKSTLPVIETTPAIIELFRSLENTTVVPEAKPGKKKKTIKAISPDLAVAVEAFSAAKKMAKYAQDEKKRFELILREALDGADIGTINGQPVIKRVESHSSHCDMQILQTAWPEAYEASHKEKPYDYLQPV